MRKDDKTSKLKTKRANGDADDGNVSPRKKAKHNNNPKTKDFNNNKETTAQASKKKTTTTENRSNSTKKSHSSSSHTNDKKKKNNNNNKRNHLAGGSGNKPNKTKKTTTTTTQQEQSASKSNNQQHREQKQARQSKRKHADAVIEAKLIWNKLRQKQQHQNPTTRRQLMTQLMPLLQGKVKDICLQHDAARVVQAALQFGTPTERRLLNEELTEQPGTLAELSKSQYAHFVVLKLIHCSCAAAGGKSGNVKKDNDDNDNKNKNNNKNNNFCAATRIVKNLSGHMAKLAVHAVGCRVVEALLTTLPNKTLIPAKLELYGPHMTLFASGGNDASLFLQDSTSTNNDEKTAKNTPQSTTTRTTTATTTTTVTLKACLQQVPQHRDATIHFVQQLIQKGMEKNLYALIFFQELMRDYGSVVSGTEIRSLLAASSSSSNSLACCDQAIHLLSSRAGVKVLCDWISYGTAKDRKSVAKSFKGYARSGLLHPQGCLALIRLIQLTDDTVILNKYIVHELVTSASSTLEDGKDNNNNKTSKTKANDDKMKDSNGDKEESDQDDEDQHPLLELALSEQASKFLLFILFMQNSEALRKALDPYEWSVLEPGTIPIVAAKGKEAEGGTSATKESSMVPTSKKDAPLRQKELFQYIQQPLIDLCTQHTEDLILSRPGSAVLRAVYQVFRPPSVVQAVIAASMVQQQTVEPDDDDDSDKSSTVLQDPIGHLAIKNLILVDANSGGGGASAVKDKNLINKKHFEPATEPLFSKAFVEAAQKQHKPKSSSTLTSPWMQLALSGNRGAFVVAALFQVKSLQEQLMSKKDIDLKALKQRLRELSPDDASTPPDDSPDRKKIDETAGIRAILKEMQTCSVESA